MGFMWLLIGIVVVAVVCAARETIRGWRHSLPERVVPLTPVCFPSVDALPAPSTTAKRHVKWISIKECERLIQTSNNILFIAVRQGSERKLLPFPAIRAMSVAPCELVDTLELISDSCVVLCGQVELCSSILGSLTDNVGSTPLYVLDATTVPSAAP